MIQILEGYIPLFRKIQEWEWFDEDATFKVFVWILMNVNFKETTWKGITIKPGEMVTSLAKISLATNHSIQEIRTILRKLQKTGEITSKSTSKYTVISLQNWKSYQIYQHAEQQTTNTQSNKQSTNNQQTTNNKV